jgi:hypothetical protein
MEQKVRGAHVQEEIGRSYQQVLAPWLRWHPNHFFAGRFSSSATHSNSCLTGLSGKPLAVSVAFASSGVSPVNCGAMYFFFRPNSESGVDRLGSKLHLFASLLPCFRAITLVDTPRT